LGEPGVNPAADVAERTAVTDTASESRLRVWGLGFRYQGLGLRVLGRGLRVNLREQVNGLGFRV